MLNKKTKSLKNKSKFISQLKSINEFDYYNTNKDFDNTHQKNKYLNEYNQYSLKLMFIDFIISIRNKIKHNYNLLMTNCHKI